MLKSTGTLSFTDISNMSCECATSPLNHSHFGHVITGDLNIIEEPQLRKICSFGTKFRDIPRLDLSSIKEQFKNDVTSLMRKISKKFKIAVSNLRKWKKSIIDAFEHRLYYFA